jgi:hypothetical protein
MHLITPAGVFDWYDGAGGTRMTLNATGLGVGVSPSYKVHSVVTSGYAGAFKSSTGVAGGILCGNTVGDLIVGVDASGNGRVTADTSKYLGLGSGGLNDRVILDASGNLLVGKSSAVATAVGIQFQPLGTSYHTLSASTNADTTLLVYSTGAAAYRFYVGLGGTVFATNTTISAISDARLKENVQDLDVGLDAILALKPRKFDWKAGKGKDIKGDRGFIAQEFEQVFPQLVDEWKDNAPEGEAPYKSVRQDLIPVLVKAIQELAAEVNALKNA